MGDRPTICLNMIVKNEEKVLPRLIGSVLPYIDYWVISDTGSTDGTVAYLESIKSRFPGEIHHDEWVDFSHNRNLSLDRARGKCDYIMTLDADHELKVNDPDWASKLTDNVYSLQHVCDGGSSYPLTHIWKDSLPGFRWVNPVHEYIKTGDIVGTTSIDTVAVLDHQDGGQSGRKRHRNDIDVLKAELEKNPDDPRSLFYLGQTYISLKMWKEGYETNIRRSEIRSFEEERWLAQFRAMECAMQAKMPINVWMGLAWKCVLERPFRRATAVTVAEKLRLMNEHAAWCASWGILNSVIYDPERLGKEIMFVDVNRETWSYDDERAITAYWLGFFQESLELCDHVLSNPKTPNHRKAGVRSNRAYAVEKLGGEKYDDWKKREDAAGYGGCEP